MRILFFAHSKSKRRRLSTIVPKSPGTKIGQRSMLSPVDCMKLNHQYGCFDAQDPDSWQNKKIQIQCGMIGYRLNDEKRSHQAESP